METKLRLRNNPDETEKRSRLKLAKSCIDTRGYKALRLFCQDKPVQIHSHTTTPYISHTIVSPPVRFTCGAFSSAEWELLAKTVLSSREQNIIPKYL